MKTLIKRHALLLATLLGFIGLLLIVAMAGRKSLASLLSTDLILISSQQRSVERSVASTAADSSIDIQIQAPGGIPLHNEQDLILRATVVLKKPITGDMEYHWILPPEAAVVAGEPEDSFANMKVGQPAHIEITLNGVSRESASNIVVFQTKAIIANKKFEKSASFSPAAGSATASASKSASMPTL